MSKDPIGKHAQGYATGMPTPGAGGMPDPHSMAGVHQREAENRRRAQAGGATPAKPAPAGGAGAGSSSPRSGVDAHWVRLVQEARVRANGEIAAIRAFKTRHAYFTGDPARVALLRRWNPAYRSGFVTRDALVDPETGKVRPDYLAYVRKVHGARLWPATDSPLSVMTEDEDMARVEAARKEIESLDRKSYDRVFWDYHALGYVLETARSRQSEADRRIDRLKTQSRWFLVAIGLALGAIVAAGTLISKGLLQ